MRSRAGMLDWLLLPLSGSPLHQVDPWVAWHARLMVLAWGVLLPLGALVARYFKIAPGQDWPRELDHRLWWHGHRGLQYAGMVLALVGVALVAWPRAGAAPAAVWPAWPAWPVWPGWPVWHARLGWLTLALGALQIVAGSLRGSKGGPTSDTLRGDHYDMTRRRQWFERLHKSGGWLAVLLACVVIALGLCAADAPRWMPALLVLWWGALAAWAWRLQRAGRCVDTYQAIWGPDARHPGNRLRPIGWGVRRPRVEGRRPL